MARKNRAANRAANREPTVEQKEQDEFIEELAGDDFNPDLDEADEETGEGEDENEEVTELEEREEEVEAKAKTEPNVKIEEEGDEAGKQKEVTSLDDDEDAGEEGDEAGVTKTPEELEAEAKAKAEEAPKPEPTAEELEAQRKAEEAKVKTPEEIAAEKEAETQKPLTDEEAAQVFTEWRQTTEELLAQHHYALTQEQIDEFEENPAAFIPKAMSRVYMDSISAAFNQFTNYLPRMVGMVLEQRESMNAAEKAFFDKWPDLLNHRDAVLRLGQAYRSANPSASMDDFINEVGAQTMVALRLNPANGNGAMQQQQTKPKPFKPAVETPSSGGPKKREGNVFEQLSQDFDMLEEEADFE